MLVQNMLDALVVEPRLSLTGPLNKFVRNCADLFVTRVQLTAVSPGHRFQSGQATLDFLAASH